MSNLASYNALLIAEGVITKAFTVHDALQALFLAGAKSTSDKTKTLRLMLDADVKYLIPMTVKVIGNPPDGSAIVSHVKSHN